MANYNMNNRNRHYYPNNRNIMHYNNPNIKPNINPKPITMNSDIPPIDEKIPSTDNFPNNTTHNDNPLTNNNIIQNLFGILNSKGLSLDKDKLILLGLMYLLYKEDKSKDNFRLLLALGYILI